MREQNDRCSSQADRTKQANKHIKQTDYLTTTYHMHKTEIVDQELHSFKSVSET